MVLLVGLGKGGADPVSLRSHEFVADSGAEAMFLVERSLQETRPPGSTREVLTRQADEDEDVWRVYLFFQEGR